MICERRHVALPIRVGSAFESQSGLQLNAPRIYGVAALPSEATIGVILMHPASNLMNHYLIDPLAGQGIGVLALNSRYCGGDSALIMEHVIQDVGAGVKFLRGQGMKTVALIGNSGGAALMAFYQAQAERLTITETPAGDPVDLRAEDLPLADGIALLAGHPGRGRLMLGYLDASVTDEADPIATDPSLDIFNTDNGPPFDAGFVARVRAGQRRRSEAITAWARERLAIIRALPDGRRDEAFVVHRTYADPRFLDLSLDPSDRKAGGNRGASAREANLSANNLGRFTTLTSWLSQWSLDTHADGPACLAATSVPVLQLDYTADGGVYPSDVALWSAAGGARIENHRLVGASHYMQGQPDLLARAVDLTVDWLKRL